MKKINNNIYVYILNNNSSSSNTCIQCICENEVRRTHKKQILFQIELNRAIYLESNNNNNNIIKREDGKVKQKYI